MESIENSLHLASFGIACMPGSPTSQLFVEVSVSIRLWRTNLAIPLGMISLRRDDVGATPSGHSQHLRRLLFGDCSDPDPFAVPQHRIDRESEQWYQWSMRERIRTLRCRWSCARVRTTGASYVCVLHQRCAETFQFSTANNAGVRQFYKFLFIATVKKGHVWKANRGCLHWCLSTIL